VFVLLLLSVTFWAQSTALTSEPGPHHCPNHCCPFCSVGLLPFLQPAVSSVVAPLFAASWLAWSPDSDPAPRVLAASGSSRAPPAA